MHVRRYVIVFNCLDLDTVTESKEKMRIYQNTHHIQPNLAGTVLLASYIQILVCY